MALRLAVAFDENTGNTFAPMVGPGTGSVVATYGQWGAGVHGSALGRVSTAGTSGTRSQLTGLGSLGTALWSAITLMAWVRPMASTGTRYPVILYDAGGNDWFGWTLPQNSPKISGFLGATTTPTSEDDHVPEDTTTWSHLCSTWDGTTLRVYVNGVLATSGAAAGPLGSLASISIGSPSWGNYGAHGVDDLRVYDEVLTPAQITSLMAVAAGAEDTAGSVNRLRLGATAPGKLYLGTTEVHKAYLGTTLVYGSGEDGENSGEDAPHLYMTPATGTYATGAAVQVTIRADSKAIATNVVQANFTYPTNRLTFQSIDTSMSPYTTTIQSTGGSGEVKIGVGILAGDTTGDQIVGVVTFTATGAGSAALSFANDSGIADSVNSTNVCEAMMGATYTIT